MIIYVLEKKKIELPSYFQRIISCLNSRKYARRKEIKYGIFSMVAYTKLTVLMDSLGSSEDYDKVNRELRERGTYYYKGMIIHRIKLIHQKRK